MGAGKSNLLKSKLGVEIDHWIAEFRGSLEHECSRQAMKKCKKCREDVQAERVQGGDT